MRKFFNVCILALLAFIVMSCVQNVDGEGENTPEIVIKKVALNIEAKVANPMNDLVGMKFEIFVDGVSKTSITLEADSVLSLELKEVEVGKNLNLVAKVYEGNNVIYEGTEKYLVKDGENKVELKLLPAKSRYFLWSNDYYTPKNEIFNGPLTGEEKFSSVAGTNEVCNFTVNNENGNIWVIEVDSNEGILKLNKYPYITGKDIKVISLEARTERRTNDCITTFYDYSKNQDVVIYAGNSTTTRKLSYIYEDGIKKGTVNITGGYNNDISAMTISGNDLYIAECIYNENDAEQYTPQGYCTFKIKIIKNIKDKIINSENGELNVSTEEIVFKNNLPVEDLTLSGEYENDKLFKTSAWKVTDMVVIDNILYALVLNNIRDFSRGALLTVNLLDKTVSEHFLYGNEKITNIDLTWMLEEDTKSMFVGPRKIVAVKPKKIEIIDDGVYDYYNETSLKRVLTVNLEDFTFSSVDMKNISFNSELDCGYQIGRF